MKHLPINKIIFLFSLLFLFACSKSNIKKSGDDCKTITICFSGEQPCINKPISFDVPQKHQYKISVSNSLCPSVYWLKVSVRSGNDPVLDTIFKDFAHYETLVELNAGTHVLAEAKLIPGNSEKICVWVGIANISICKTGK